MYPLYNPWNPRDSVRSPQSIAPVMEKKMETTGDIYGKGLGFREEKKETTIVV